MKKAIAFFAFLCFAVGGIGAKDDLKTPEGSRAKIDTKKLEYAIPYIQNLRTISSPATVSCASRLPASPTTR